MKILIISILLICIPIKMNAQKIRALQSINSGAHPELRWFADKPLLETEYKVWRTNLKENKSNIVETIMMKVSRNDTMFYVVVDTTLTERALYKYYLEFITARDSILVSETLYGHNLGNLPAPAITEIYSKSALNRKAIELEWKLNYNFTVKSLALFRSRHYDDGYELIAHLPADATHYVDPVDISNEPYYYFIQIRDFFGYQLPTVRVHGICTYAEKPYPPQNFSAALEDGKVIMNWEISGGNVLYSRIYRKTGMHDQFMPIAQLGVPDKIEGEFVDESLDNFEGEEISYYVVNISDGFLKSNPSETKTIKLSADKDILAPRQLTYVFDSLQNVKLIWSSLEADPNVRGYNVYRALEDQMPLKLNSDLLHFGINYWTDSTVEPGRDYLYEIETISITNQPALVRTRVQVRTALPDVDMLITLSRVDNGIQLSWLPPSIQGIKEIHLYRQTINGEPSLIRRLPASETSFVDRNLALGTDYLYFAIAKMETGADIILNKGVVIRGIGD